MPIDIAEIINSLASKRSVFHSEADFQHALAWEIHQAYPSSAIRLEIPSNSHARQAIIDMIVRIDGQVLFFELKYKTARATIDSNGEQFQLKGQSANPQGNYKFVMDVSRIEAFVASNPGAEGYAIILSNDHKYWNTAAHDGTVDREFRLTDQRMLTGKLDWTEGASAGTKMKCEHPITLRGCYHINWLPYSRHIHTKNGAFRYLCLHVTA